MRSHLGDDPDEHFGTPTELFGPVISTVQPGNSRFLPRIKNTAAGFKLLVWRRVMPDHRCSMAPRSGVYETFTLMSFPPSGLPPERSL